MYRIIYIVSVAVMYQKKSIQCLSYKTQRIGTNAIQISPIRMRPVHVWDIVVTNYLHVHHMSNSLYIQYMLGGINLQGRPEAKICCWAPTDPTETQPTTLCAIVYSPCSPQVPIKYTAQGKYTWQLHYMPRDLETKQDLPQVFCIRVQSVVI